MAARGAVAPKLDHQPKGPAPDLAARKPMQNGEHRSNSVVKSIESSIKNKPMASKSASINTTTPPAISVTTKSEGEATLMAVLREIAENPACLDRPLGDWQGWLEQAGYTPNAFSELVLDLSQHQESPESMVKLTDLYHQGKADQQKTGDFLKALDADPELTMFFKDRLESILGEKIDLETSAGGTSNHWIRNHPAEAAAAFYGGGLIVSLLGAGAYLYFGKKKANQAGRELANSDAIHNYEKSEEALARNGLDNQLSSAVLNNQNELIRARVSFINSPAEEAKRLIGEKDAGIKAIKATATKDIQKAEEQFTENTKYVLAEAEAKFEKDYTNRDSYAQLMEKYRKELKVYEDYKKVATEMEKAREELKAAEVKIEKFDGFTLLADLLAEAEEKGSTKDIEIIQKQIDDRPKFKKALEDQVKEKQAAFDQLVIEEKRLKRAADTEIKAIVINNDLANKPLYKVEKEKLDKKIADISSESEKQILMKEKEFDEAAKNLEQKEIEYEAAIFRENLVQDFNQAFILNTETNIKKESAQLLDGAEVKAKNAAEAEVLKIGDAAVLKIEEKAISEIEQKTSEIAVTAEKQAIKEGEVLEQEIEIEIVQTEESIMKKL